MGEIIPYNIIRILRLTVRTTILIVLLLTGGVGAATLIMEDNDSSDYNRAQEGVITGEVTTSNGTPVANAEIYVSGPSHGNTYTDENGNYRLGGLLAGSYILDVNPPYGSDLIRNSMAVSVDLEETVTIDIILQKGGVVTGEVTTSNGTPVANAEIYVSGPSHGNTYTDENGNYRLKGLSAGNYTIYAYPPYGSDLAWNYTNVIVRSGETRIVDIILRISDTMPPVFPMCLYGNATINEEPAPDGTTILAKIDNEVRGSAIVKDGKYGEPAYNRLIVNGNEKDNGKIIQFYIKFILANETIQWHSGNVSRFDISFETISPIIDSINLNNTSPNALAKRSPGLVTAMDVPMLV